MPVYTQTHVLGAGEIFLSALNAEGAAEGFRYVGETPELALTVATEKVELFSSDSAVSRKIESVVTQTNYSLNFATQNVDFDNLALFFLGEKETVNQPVASVLDEVVRAKPGLWHPLGWQTEKTGVKNIINLVVQDESNTTTYVQDTDFELDAANGELYILPGGAIAEDAVLHVDYDTPAESRARVLSAGSLFKGALKFKSDNTAGANRNAVFRSIRLEPTGDFALKSRSDWQQLGFVAEVLEEDSGTAAVYVEGISLP